MPIFIVAKISTCQGESVLYIRTARARVCKYIMFLYTYKKKKNETYTYPLDDMYIYSVHHVRFGS